MPLEDEAALFREMNDLSVDHQRLPLLHGVEGPMIALAGDDQEFNAEELLARPKSNVCVGILYRRI